MSGIHPDCAALQSLQSFNEYITLLRSETDFSQKDLATCRREICIAIWGDGNPDISGIGVTIAYVIEVVLGATLVILSSVLNNKKRGSWQTMRLVVRAGLEAYFEFVVYFAVSIEIAAIVLLVNKDFGLSTDEFGAADAQMALAISVLCILPLLHPLSLLRSSKTRLEPEKAARDHAMDHPREMLYLLLYSLLAVLFLYPFVSQGIHNWAASRVGEGQGENGETIVTASEWVQVTSMCFGAHQPLAAWERRLLAATEMAASLLIYIFTLWQLLSAIANKMEVDDQDLGELRRTTMVLRKVSNMILGCYIDSKPAQIFIAVLPLGLAAVLLYGVFRMRAVQKSMLEGMGARYDGNGWGYGQILGVVIFIPVLVEMCFATWRGFRTRRE